MKINTIWIINHNLNFDGWILVSAHISVDGAKKAAREYVKTLGWNRLKERTDDDGLPYWQSRRYDQEVCVESLDLDE